MNHPSKLFGEDAREWLARSIGTGTGHLDVVPMAGSTSSSLYLIRCSKGRAPQRFVLRVLDNKDWLAHEPDLAAHEAAALEEAERAGLPAPRLLAYSSDDVGFGAPVVLMSFIEGSVELRPSNVREWLEALARQLVSIHRHPARSFPWTYRSWLDRSRLVPPTWAGNPRLWERAIECVLAPRPDTGEVFLHRDFHPTNVLWHRGAVSGVVDWINACRGPAGVDVAHCRRNLAQMYGPPAADQFLQAYTRRAEGFEYDPYWDVESILDASLPQPAFYPPWEGFGLDFISPETLQRRMEALLERVLD